MKKSLILAAMALAATTAWAFDDGEGPGGPRPDRRAHMREVVGLTEEQEKTIESIRSREKEAIKGLREQLESKALEYRELKAANSSKAKALREEIKDLRDEIAIRRLAMHAEIGKVFTPEQRQKLEEMREQRPPRGPRRGPGRGPREP